MTDERILTLHPEGKQGTNIERRKYDAMKRAILEMTPRQAPGVRFVDLPRLIAPHLDPGVFTQGVSISWYVTTVKLDLEARGMLERSSDRPQRLIRTRAKRRPAAT